MIGKLPIVAGLLASSVAAQERIVTVRDPARLVAMGERIEIQGELLPATVFYERALELAPSFPAALRAAGANAIKRGAWDAAAHYYATWANIEPRNPEALIGLGNSLLLHRRSREALAVLQRAADLGGDVVAIARLRGVAFDLEGDAKNAQAAYAEVINAVPADGVATQRMALSLALAGDNGAAVTLLQRFGPEPDAAEVRRTLATVYALGGRFDDAADIVASIMPLDEARKMQSFHRRLPQLGPRDRALAVHFGILPGAATPAPPIVQAPRWDQPGMYGVAASAVTPPDMGAAKPLPQPLAPDLLKARSRLWVQLASSANPAKLAGEWRHIRETASETMAGQIPYVQRAGPHNRLLIGPFDSASAARVTVAKLKARRVASVLNRTPVGADLAPLN